MMDCVVKRETSSGLPAKARVFVHVRDEERFHLPGDPSGHALADLEPEVLELLGAFSHRKLEPELVSALVQKEQRPVLRLEKLVYLLHDDVEYLFEVKRGGEGLAYLRESRELKPHELPARSSRVRGLPGPLRSSSVKYNVTDPENQGAESPEIFL